MQFLYIYLILINLITLILFVVDKYKAIKGKWRIPEKTLILFTAFGGAFFGILAMILARHKIRKLKFQILPTLFLVIHILIILQLEFDIISLINKH